MRVTDSADAFASATEIAMLPCEITERPVAVSALCVDAASPEAISVAAISYDPSAGATAASLMLPASFPANPDEQAASVMLSARAATAASPRSAADRADRAVMSPVCRFICIAPSQWLC